MNANEPAFPLPLGNENVDPAVAGLTKRELFAAMAMIGLCANPAYAGHAEVGGEKLAQWSEAQADLLVTALSKEQP